MGENKTNDHRAMYKRTSIARSPEELIKRRVAIDESLRRKHREQLITAKRFRHLTRREEQESAGESEPEEAINEHDEDIGVDYRLNKEKVANIAQDLKSSNKQIRTTAAQYIARFVVQPSQAMIDYIVEGDCIETLTHMLSGTEADEQIQAVQTLSNIAAGPYNLWIKSIPTASYLIQLLDSDNTQLCELVATALGNMAAEELGDMTNEDDEVRDTIRKNGAILPLARMLESSDSHTVQSSCFALANLARGREDQLHEYVAAGVPEKLLHHLENETSDTITEVCGVMSYLAAGSQEFRDKVIQDPFLSLLMKEFVELAERGPMVLPALRTLGHLASGPDESTHILLQQEDFLPTIAKLLRSDHRAVLKETLWVLSNLTATKSQQVIDKVDASGALAVLLDVVKRPAFDIRAEASKCVMNVMVHSEKHREELPHKELLPVRSQEEGTIRLGLGYVEMLMNKVPNGKLVMDQTPEFAEALASVNPAPDEELYKLANELVDQYYGETPDMCD